MTIAPVIVRSQPLVARDAGITLLITPGVVDGKVPPAAETAWRSEA